MLVECPNCHTKFNLPEENAKPGAKLKCSQCGHVFELELEKDEEEQAEEEEEQLVRDVQESEEDYSAGETPEEESGEEELNLDITSGEKGGNRKLVWAMSSLFVLICAAFAVYFFVPSVSGLVDGMLNKEKGEEEVLENKEMQKAAIENIHLENVRQYFVSNEKVGQIFVIEGKAVNRFEKPKELIKLKAVLYDAKGEKVKSKEFFCGNSVSLFQLQVSTQKELESSLTARVGVLTNNTFIKPGKSTPFMVAFYNPPEEVQEFGLEVVQAENPPKDRG